MRRIPLPVGPLASLLLAPLAGLHAGESPRPNILLIYADDLGYGELGCYGSKEVPTPHIDSIATNGIRFTSGYVSAPLCSPSRAGLMTGRYQQRFGHENNDMAPPGRGLPAAEVTLAQRLKALGYATAIVGKWHLGNDADLLPMKRGFDEYYGVTGNPGSYFAPKGFLDSRVSPEARVMDDEGFYSTDAFAARAADWIDRHRDAPWFLYLPFNAVHTPHEASEKYLQRFPHIAEPRRRNFDGMLSAMDDAVGAVLAKLRALGLEERTLIFFISDNGAPGPRGGNGQLRGGKHTCWEGGMRVPWILQWKGTLPAGKTEERAVSQLDVMPTCIAAAGGTTDPAWKLDGSNLLPHLSGDDTTRIHQTLFWRIDGMWAVRHGDLKLVRGEMDDAAPALFDLAADPGETNDLAPTQPDKVAELKALWDSWNSQLAPPSRPKVKRSKSEKRRVGAERAGKRARRAKAASGT